MEVNTKNFIKTKYYLYKLSLSVNITKNRAVGLRLIFIEVLCLFKTISLINCKYRIF